jgi:dGTPase
LLPKDDHYRTRLTHTLEVAQIARTIARALRLNEDLTEAIALGHDLGHTPFGHDGERVLDRLFSVGFRHNEQSVRVADTIVNNGKGLNLTVEVRDGILNHSSKSKASTCEGDVVRLSDKIAYINHDIEDAVHSGVLKNSDLPHDVVRVLGSSKSKRISTLINSVVNNSQNGVICYDSETQKAHDTLRAFMFESVYNSPKVNVEKEKAIHVIEFLYDYYKANPHEMPAFYQELQGASGERAVCDYISGMTDGFAVDVFMKLCVPRAWR